ncbi:type II CRISPR-associated endonuclease Cas1 [uncultured Helicobacter sp.]|uniref:type II CRISPR-associated endonuclease Cas1 n=1 Tax=uncultured Helicobacter sp. TaxID=175537 RepID=UPI00375354FF
MGYDEAFRNVIITSRAHLSLQDNHLVVQNGEERARLYIKDLHCVILESPQITLTQALLNALAQSKVLLLTCDRTHAISGVFTPFLGHFANAQVAREHIAVSTESKAKLWQQIVQNKIHNQAFVLRTHGYVREAENLAGLCERVLLEDSSNVEANAAALYFKTLFGEGFSRKAKHKIHNALLDYGYAIVRGCVIRSVCMSGLLTWAGIKHSNQFNQFNLCDDIIEVFRPFVDRCVLGLLESRARGVMESRGDCVESTQYQSLDSKLVRVRGKASEDSLSMSESGLSVAHCGEATESNPPSHIAESKQPQARDLGNVCARSGGVRGSGSNPDKQERSFCSEMSESRSDGGVVESRGDGAAGSDAMDSSVLDSKEYLETLTKEDKKALVANLQSEARVGAQTFPLARAINHYVQRFKNALLYSQPLPWVEIAGD